MKLTIMGPPGSGKGTQAERLCAALGLPHISTGAIIRNAIREETALGQKAKSYIEQGHLVPDDVVIGMVSERLKQDDCTKGFVLDGFPRTIVQAQALEKMGIELDCALNLSVSDDAIVKRLSGRRECKKCAAPYHVDFNPPKKEGICDKCGGELIMRADDVPETIRERLSVYHKETEPLTEFYRNNGLLKSIEGCDGIEETTRAVLEALGVKG